MAVASLTLSIVALIVAAAGFGWTVFEWHRSGARLKVNATSFVMVGGMAARRDEPPDFMIAIEVTNAGRTAATVSAVGFQSPEYKGVIVLAEPAAGPNPIPARLEPGESFMYPLDPAELHRACGEHEIGYKSLLTYANSGHGIFKGKFAKVGMDVLARRAPSSGIRRYPRERLMARAHPQSWTGLADRAWSVS